MKRRAFFERLAEWAAALGFSGAAAAGPVLAREKRFARHGGDYHCQRLQLR